MPANKKHHYVPQFYLKFFSNDEDSNFINVFNINSNKVINNVPINTQSYKDYYYGKNNKVEHALGDLENFSITILKNIQQVKKLPQKTSDEYKRLLLFINIQMNRTLWSGDVYNEFINNSCKSIINIHPELEDIRKDIDNISIEESEPSNIPIEIACESFTYLLDLECKLIINNTKIPFITSDNPVIKYNLLTEKIKYPFGGCGILSKGLKIFYPISPHVCIILYDKIVYKIGNKFSKTITILDEKSIVNLNMLQILNSTENIFFNDITYSHYIPIWFDTIKTKRFKNKVSFKKFKISETKIITRSNEKDIRIKLDLSFIKYTDNAKKI